MYYLIIGSTRRGQDPKEEIKIAITKDDVEEFVNDVKDEVDGYPPAGSASLLERSSKDFVLRMSNSGPVYLTWEDHVLEINMRPSPLAVVKEIVNLVEGGSYGTISENQDAASEVIGKEESEGTDLRDLGTRDDPRSNTGTGERESSEEKDRRTNRDTGRESEEVTFIPPYTKEQADYVDSKGYADEGPNCEDCVHYIEGGNCHLVRGDIDPDAHCINLYSDVGVFGLNEDGSFEVNFKLLGEKLEERFRNITPREVGDQVEESIRDDI